MSLSDNLSDSDVENEVKVERKMDEIEEESDQQRKKPKITSMDIISLRETNINFKSNIFKMEIDELLSEIKIKSQSVSKINKLIVILKKTILNIPESEPIPIQNIAKVFNNSKIAVCFIDPPPSGDTKYLFKYEKPNSIEIIGSFSLHSSIKCVKCIKNKNNNNNNNKTPIDMCVEIPETVFNDKDYLNYRYFHKRSFYVSYLARGIKNAVGNPLLPISISYEYLDGNVLKPIIRIDPLDNGGDLDFSHTNCYFRIIPSISQNTFPLQKLLNSKNSIRTSIKEDEQIIPTSFYNNSILSEFTQKFYIKYIKNEVSKSPSLLEAALLGAIWLRSRNFNESIQNGGFGWFELIVLMTSLLNTKIHGSNHNILLRGFSSYQLFKAFIQFLANDIQSFSFASQSNSKFNSNSDSQLLPAIFDTSLGFNLLFKMSPASYAKLIREATVSLQMLNDNTKDRFDELFLFKSSIHYTYDLTVSLPLYIKLIQDNFTQLDKIKFISYENYLLHTLYNILNKSLGKRAKSIEIIQEPLNSWPIKYNSPISYSSSSDAKIIIGLFLDTDYSESIITKGPSAEDKFEAEKFREFWGSKAELRRFKDGVILESVVWSSKNNNNTLTMQILSYIFSRHFGLGLSDTDSNTPIYLHNSLNKILLKSNPSLSASVSESFYKSSIFNPVLTSFESLSKKLTSLKQSPLRIKSVLPVSSTLRYSSIIIPEPFNFSQPSSILEVYIQFEGSARWPDNIEAIEKTKAAFLLTIADELEGFEEGYKCFAGVENSDNLLLNYAYIDIITPEGYKFRVRILCERLLTLYNRKIHRATNYIEKRKAEKCLESYERVISLISHTRDIQVYCRRYVYLSSTIRLVKIWFASLLLLCHVNDVIIENIVLQIFLDPYPWYSPASLTTGFLRTLWFLSHWDWRVEPLIVGSDEDFYQESIDKFDSLRKLDPSFNRGAWFIVTKNDKSGILWTKDEPNKVVAARITTLAQASLDISTSSFETNDKLYFTPSYKDYDFVINIKLEQDIVHSSGFKNIDMMAALEKSEATNSQLIQMFLNELKRTYGDLIFWFYNDLKMKKIAGVWNPIYLKEKKFKPTLGYNSYPVYDSSDDVLLNKKAIIGEISRLGSEMISTIVEK